MNITRLIYIHSKSSHLNSINMELQSDQQILLIQIKHEAYER